MRHVLRDKWLILRFRHGSQEAFCRIYERYRDDLLRLAVSLLKDKSAAEDVVHEVFAGLIGARQTFTLTGSLRAYLATCVVNRVRDQVRARRRQGQAIDEELSLESDFDPPNGRILSDERSRLVARALARLPDEQREIIALHLNGQLKLREIARLQGIPLTTVRGRYRHGIDRLRSILNGRL